MIRLNRSDWIFIAICVAIAALSVFVVLHWFTRVFPEASIDFRYDRDSSRSIAEPLVAAQVGGMKHTAVFDGDDQAKIFLERTLGLARATPVMRSEVRLWWWHHRWFRPLQEEELAVDVAPTGEIVGYDDTIPEARALPSPDVAGARRVAEAFLGRARVNLADLQLVSQSERRLPQRMQRIFTWESQSVHPAGTAYRHVVTVDGDRVGSYRQKLRVPDQWSRSYEELRSKNGLAGLIDSVLLLVTGICIIVVFVVRLLRGDVRLRFAIGIFLATFVLAAGVALNSFPSALASYSTTSSYSAFLAQFVFFRVLLWGIGVGIFLVVVAGVGEVMYRERLPQHLAIPRLWTPRALASRRVFRSLILGYTLVALFLGYQVAFYLIADKFGAWSPAEVPYDSLLNTAFPWVVVLFAGFFPAMSEEFMSRAFSIPFFEKIFRSRVAAVAIAAFIWGFGHSTYPNQPFFIRGLEVGIAGCILGAIFYRFGLLPLLIWHYTVDALYTALLLLRSGNRYYVVSGALSSLVFAIPMLVSIVLYVKPASVDDVIDYRTTKTQAVECAGRAGALPKSGGTAAALHIAVQPQEGFRSWARDSPREEGGSPNGFDPTAAEYLVRHGLSMQKLVEIMRTRIEAATWMVRAYKPQQKEEVFVEVDPRTDRTIGYHKYQSETNPGERLDQAPAQAIAQAAFARYGVDGNAFDVKEALAFQQPNRRDWLFHFEERQPIAAEGHRRISVRVAGAEVTQFTTTIKIPDSVYREEAKETLLNVILGLVRLAAMLLALALIIAGLVIAARKGHFPWQRALRWTLVLAMIPIADAVVHWPLSLFDYQTSEQWQTFITANLVRTIFGVGVKLGALFIAIAGIDIAYPHALELRTRAARARVGRAALVAAVTAVALMAIARIAAAIVEQRFPRTMSIDGLRVPQSVALPLPSLWAIGDAMLLAIAGAAAIGLFVLAIRSFGRTTWLPDVIGVALLFGLTIDSRVTPTQLPSAIAGTLLAALLIWALVRFVLGRNLLAYPLAILLRELLFGAPALLQNHREDLTINGIVMLAAAAAVALWAVLPREPRDA